MNSRYLEDEDIDSPPREREISLGATTILGIFLLLALVCAIFFGFGYSMGRRSSLAVAPAPDAVPPAKATAAAKPNPGLTPAINPSTDSADASSEDAPSAGTQLPQPVHAPAEVAIQQNTPPTATTAARSPADSPQPTPAVSKPDPQPVLHPTSAGGPAVVQVAAVSHQEDADMLVNALKRRGYDVAIRHESQDKLLHIQIGPYPTRKDADVMRQRLLADGYNAIVK